MYPMFYNSYRIFFNIHQSLEIICLQYNKTEDIPLSAMCYKNVHFSFLLFHRLILTEHCLTKVVSYLMIWFGNSPGSEWTSWKILDQVLLVWWSWQQLKESIVWIYCKHVLIINDLTFFNSLIIFVIILNIWAMTEGFLER